VWQHGTLATPKPDQMSRISLTGPVRLSIVRITGFPDEINEVAARLVAAGVVAMAVTFVATGWTPVLVVLAYGFVARVLSGPRLSPLALLVTRVVVPRLRLRPRFVPGPPKRFAQGIGATFSLTAVALVLVGALGAAQVVIAALAAAAFLEAAFGFCLGCRVFALLMQRGVIPADACDACNDLSRRLTPQT
jgi:hypothetical protein